MKKQIQFLLEKISSLVNLYEILVKYEFNSDIEIHFIKITSNKIDNKILNTISDNLYVDFVKEFPHDLVAVLDESSKYEFRFDILFDNSLQLKFKDLEKNEYQKNADQFDFDYESFDYLISSLNSFKILSDIPYYKCLDDCSFNTYNYLKEEISFYSKFENNIDHACVTKWNNMTTNNEVLDKAQNELTLAS